MLGQDLGRAPVHAAAMPGIGFRSHAGPASRRPAFAFLRSSKPPQLPVGARARITARAAEKGERKTPSSTVAAPPKKPAQKKERQAAVPGGAGGGDAPTTTTTWVLPCKGGGKVRGAPAFTKRDGGRG